MRISNNAKLMRKNKKKREKILKKKSLKRKRKKKNMKSSSSKVKRLNLKNLIALRNNMLSALILLAKIERLLKKNKKQPLEL